MALAEHDWATYGLPDLIPACAAAAPSPRGSASSAWNALHGFGDFVASSKDSAGETTRTTAASPRKQPTAFGGGALDDAFACADCGDVLTTRRELALHRKTHAMERKFQCSWCVANFRTLSHLKTHVVRKHTDIDANSLTMQNTSRATLRVSSTSNPTVLSPSSTGSNHFALHSVKVAGFKRDREYAEDEEEEPDEFTTGSPILELQQKAGTQRHASVSSISSEDQKRMASIIANEHIEFLIPEVTEFPSPQSNAVSEEASRIEAKMMILFQGNGADRRNYRCPVCLYCFKQPKGVDDHLPSHESGYNHECYFCMGGFDNTEDLIEHTKVHLGDSQFQCSICSKTFRKKSGLKTHLVKNHGKKMRTHSPTPAPTPAFQLASGTSSFHLSTRRKSSISSLIPQLDMDYNDDFATL